MLDNSSKLFRKILKTGLVTASGAAIMFGSTGALGAARTTTAPNVNFDTGNGLDGGGQLAPGSTVQFIDDTHNVSDFNRNVGSIDMNGKVTNAVVTASVNTGSIIANGGSLAVTINNAQTLTLIGDAGGGANNYTGLGAITLGGATAGLTINSATPATVTILASEIKGADAAQGILTVNTPTNFTAAIGGVLGAGQNYLNKITFNANSELLLTLDTARLEVGAAQVTAAGMINADSLVFIADGQVTLGSGVLLAGNAASSITNLAPNTGTLIINGGSIKNVGTADTGAGNPGPLKLVTFNSGAGPVTAQNIFATTVTIGEDAGNVASVVEAGAITGAVNFAADGALTANNGITGNVDFKGVDGTVTLADAQVITGTVDSSTGAGNLGKLVFIGDGTVTKDVGATKAINYIDIQGDNNTAVILQGNVNTQILKFTQNAANEAATVKITGNFAGAVTFTASATAFGDGGIIEFNDATANASHTFAATLTGAGNAGNGQIIVNTALLTATDSSIFRIGSVKINDQKAFAVDAKLADVALFAVTDFSFVGNNSQLVLTNSSTTDDRTITFNDDLDPGGNVGIVTLQSKGNKLLTLNSIDGTKKLGTGDNFKALNVDGKVTISGVFPGAGQNRLNVSGADLLNLYNGATFTDQGATSGGIATINIGAARPAGAVTGAALPVGTAKYILDVSSFAAANAAAPINLLSDAANNNVLSFLSAASEFTIQNTAAADQLVIFQNHVKGFDTGGAAGGGVVNLINTDADNTLIVSGADAKKAQLGNTNNIAQLNITGKVQVLGNYAPGAGYNALDLSRSDLLSIYKDATFVDESATSGSIKKINIGGALPAGGGAGKAIYGLDVSTFAVANAAAPVAINLLSDADNANVLSFLSADSIFAIQNTAAANQQVIFQNHVVGINNAGNGGGIVNLINTNAGVTLIVSGADAKKAQLGNTNNLAELNITGKVIVTGDYDSAGGTYDALDVSRSDLLTVNNDSFFIDLSSTSASIKTINVGDDAEYRLEVSTKAALAAAGAPAPINLLSDATNANVLTFLNADSVFTIENTFAGDQQVIFQNHVQGAAGDGGAVNLRSTGGNTLTVSGANAKQAQLGNTNALTSLNIAGKVTVTGNPTPGAAFNALDISNSGSLNVFNGGSFIDQSATSDLIAGGIFIGENRGRPGDTPGPAAHAIDVSYAPGNAKNLLTVANQIVFRDPNSAYEIQNLVNAQDTTVTLQNTLAGGYDDNAGNAANNGGIVYLTSSNANTLTVQSKTGGETLGAVGNALSALGITGKVTIAGTAGKAVDISNTQVLDVYNGATFTDKSATSATIAEINIGADPAGGAATGAAVHVIDVSTAAGAAVNLLGDNVIFKDAGSTLKIQNTVAFDKTVTLTNSIEGNVPNGAGGIVELNAATNKLTINGGKTLGTNANKLQTLKLSGNGEIVLTGTKYFATNLDLSIKAVTLDDVPQHLEFSGDTILTETGNIASVDFKGKNAIINMANGTNITGAVTNTVAPPTNNGTINFEGTGTIGGNITGLAMLKVGAGAVTLTAGGPTVITEIQGTGTDTLTLPANFTLTGDINKTAGTAFKLNFTNGGSVSGVVGTAANSVGDITTAGVTSFASSVNAKGTATFGGTTSFADTFNNTGAVTLAAQSINTFNKQITATSMVANNATMIINAPMSISGTNLTGSGTTITLGSNQLLLSAGTKAAFTDQLTLNTNFDGTTNTGGNILITGAGSEMDLSGVTKLKVVISTTNFDLNNINPNTQYTLAAAASEGTLKQLASADAIETDIGTQENQFLKWTLNPTSLVLSPSIVDNVNDRIEEELTTGDLKDASLGVKADIRALETATDPNSEGFKFKVTMGNILDNEELTTKVMKAVGDSQDQVPSSDAVNNTTVAVTNTVVSAMGSLNSRMNSFQAVNQPIAVASGDEDEAKFGVWATPFVGNSTQKMRNNINGNKTNFGGATVGFDGMINDQVVLGVAYTRAGTKIKQKNDKIGDSSKVKSNIYSIYGLYNLPNNNLFFQAVGSYSDSRIKSYSQRYQPVARNTLATQIANGNYKSRGFTGQIMAGYDYVAPQAVKLTPMVGLRYSKVKDSGYTETGTTLQNLIVKGKNYNLVNGLAGVKLSKDINTGHMILTPEIYGMLDYGFKNKLPTPDARLQGMTTPFPASKFKPVKTTWNVGAGVTAKYKMMEYGVNYDANIASKYFAQQGSVKIRVNF